MYYISIHPREGIHSDTSFILGTTKNTNLAIGGFLAGLHRSLLIFLFALSGFTDNLKINNARDFQPIDFRRSINWHCLWRENSSNFIFEFCNFFHRQRAEMVWKRSRVTSPCRTPPVIPIATVNRCLPCNHLLSNMCNPWLPLGQS